MEEESMLQALEKGIPFNIEALKITPEDVGYIESQDIKVDPPEIIPKVDAPFAEITADMIAVDDQGLVKKQIIKNGVGRILQLDSIVLVHYQMYFEGEIEPFDSTIMRQKPARFKLQDGCMLEGLFIALQSMRLKEVSRFVISWQKAFHELGCPPRIKPRADILVEVEVVKLVDIVDPNDFGELPDPENEFMVLMDRCTNMLQNGKEAFASRKYEQSLRWCFDALNFIERVRINSDQEQDAMEKLKVRLHLNLSGILIHVNRPEQASVQCQEVLRLDHTHPKALLNYGKANTLLNNFDKAASLLQKGRRLHPGLQAFDKELGNLERKKAAFLAQEQRVRELGEPEK